MERVGSILVGIDLGPRGARPTPGSRLAVEVARWLAPPLGARVLLHHSSAADEAFSTDEGDYVVVPPGLRRAGREALEAVAADLREAGIDAELHVSDEKAWLGIVRRVLRDGIDLVVTGKRSEPVPADRHIGSVAMKLVRKCPCPVWVAKPGSAVPPRRVLAATDLSPVGERVVRLAADVAARADAELHAVHALQMPLAVQFEGERGEEDWKRRELTEAVRAIEAVVGTTEYPGEPACHVGLTAPTRAVTGCVDRLEPDLVVMGSVSRGGIAGVIVGNTAERLLDRLDVSLLVVKPDDFVCPVDRG